MFGAFLFNRFKHLKSAYVTEKAFYDHFLSGEVQISIPDAITAMEEYQQSQPVLPSAHQIGDNVFFIFGDVKIPAKILPGISFYNGKVKYNLELLCYDQQVPHDPSKIDWNENEIEYKPSEPAVKNTTRIYNVDSVFVTTYNH